MDVYDNSYMVDWMVNKGYITSQEIERVFRLVDRHLFLPSRYPIDYFESAGSSNKSPGTINILSAHIYSAMLEQLNLSHGQSFLNIGSGSGYLSTLAGFLLGGRGQNHGIEVDESVVNHARAAVGNFSESPVAKAFLWTPPRFVHGDAFSLTGIESRYDRILIGGKVLQGHVPFFLNMLKEGGVLVVPVMCKNFTNAFRRYKKNEKAQGGAEWFNFYCGPIASLIYSSPEGSEHPIENSETTEMLKMLFNPKSLLSLALHTIRFRLLLANRLANPTVVSQTLTYALRRYERVTFKALKARMLQVLEVAGEDYASSDENILWFELDRIDYHEPDDHLATETTGDTISLKQKRSECFLESLAQSCPTRNAVSLLSICQSICGKETSKATSQWMSRLKLILDLPIPTMDSIEEEVSELLTRKIESLPTGGYSIEDFVLKRKQDGYKERDDMLNLLKSYGEYQLRQEVGQFWNMSYNDAEYLPVFSVSTELRELMFRRYSKTYEKRVMALPIPNNEKEIILSSFIY